MWKLSFKEKCMLRKHELKVVTEKMRRRNTIYNRKRINFQFKRNSKLVYRKFKNEEDIEVKVTPSKEEVEQFWGGIWGVEKKFNKYATWLAELKENYCKNATTINYKITEDLVKDVVNKMPNNKAPGRDLITHFWYKKLSVTIKPIVQITTSFFEESNSIP